MLLLGVSSRKATEGLRTACLKQCLPWASIDVQLACLPYRTCHLWELCMSVHSQDQPCPLQDTTTRVWDLRRLDKSLAALQGTMGAIRSLRFSPDGSTLAVAEPADFVHLHDVQSDFVRWALSQSALLLWPSMQAVSRCRP